MCTVYINTIVDTALLLREIKFTGNQNSATKENDNSALGRTKQDRANIMLPFRIVYRPRTKCLLTSTAYNDFNKLNTWQTNLYRAFWKYKNKITPFCITPVKQSVI